MTPPDQKLISRFEKGFERSGSDDCWPWKRGITSDGYGGFSVNKKNVLAHRVAYWIATGTMPPSEICVCHHCDNRACVNPDHLFLGTVTENNKDRHQKGRSAGGSLPGETNPMAVLSSATIMAVYNASGTQASIAKKYGVAYQLVSAVKNGTVWASVTGAKKKRKHGDDGLTCGQRRLLQTINGETSHDQISMDDVLRQCGWSAESSLYRALRKLKRMGLIDKSSTWSALASNRRGQ